MSIPKEIIDNSEGNKLISFLNKTLKENPQTKFDIATAFFNRKNMGAYQNKVNLHSSDKKEIANFKKNMVEV